MSFTDSNFSSIIRYSKNQKVVFDCSHTKMPTKPILPNQCKMLRCPKNTWIWY